MHAEIGIYNVYSHIDVEWQVYIFIYMQSDMERIAMSERGAMLHAVETCRDRWRGINMS